jgi:hypothetical protein
VPLFVGNLAPVGIVPANVVDPRTMNFAPLKPVAAGKGWMLPPKMNQAFGEIQQGPDYRLRAQSNHDSSLSWQ